MDKGAVIISILTVAVIGGLFASASLTSKKESSVPAQERCVEHGGAISEHYHPELFIYDHGKPVEIPSNIGISPTCMRPLHTHDNSGTIHVETPIHHDFTVGDFFSNWGKPFSKDQLLDFKNGNGGTITMMVNGQPNTQFESYIMKDGDKIELRFE